MKLVLKMFDACIVISYQPIEYKYGPWTSVLFCKICSGQWAIHFFTAPVADPEGDEIDTWWNRNMAIFDTLTVVFSDFPDTSSIESTCKKRGGGGGVENKARSDCKNEKMDEIKFTNILSI